MTIPFSHFQTWHEPSVEPGTSEGEVTLIVTLLFEANSDRTTAISARGSRCMCLP